MTRKKPSFDEAAGSSILGIDAIRKAALELRRRAESKAKTDEPGIREPRSLEETRHVLHELHVHQIELEMQNEELRRAQEALEALRARYFDLYDLAPVGYFVLSEKGMILEANLTASTLLGVERGVFLKTPITRYIFPEDQDIYYRRHKQLLETGAPQACELRLLKNDGSTFWARMEAAAATSDEGEPLCRATVSDITERKRAEEAAGAALREKEILLREIHHRVKNNMQVISSLISLQSEHIMDGEARRMLKEGQLRIRSMALVHEKLYQSRALSKIDFGGYLRSLSTQLFQFFKVDAGKIRLETNLEEVLLDVNSAVPCGLLANELITNALKHAFPGDRTGTVRIRLHRRDDGAVELRVADDGVGIPETVDVDHTESLGLQIVSLLVGQIDGALQLDGKNGAAFTIVFREPEQREA